MATESKSLTTAPWRKIGATGVILLAGGTVVSAGAFAVFTDSGTVTIGADAGQLDILMSENYTVSGIAPGDIVQRPVDITLPDATNDGDLISAVRFFFDVTTDTAGTDDPALPGLGESLVTGADGLDFTMSTCSGGTWTTAAAPAEVGPYTCAGTVEVTQATVKLSTIDGVLNAVDLVPADFGVVPTAEGTFSTDAGDVTLSTLVQFELPATADNDYENAATQLLFTAAAIQRDGIQR